MTVLFLLVVHIFLNLPSTIAAGEMCSLRKEYSSRQLLINAEFWKPGVERSRELLESILSTIHLHELHLKQQIIVREKQLLIQEPIEKGIYFDMKSGSCIIIEETEQTEIHYVDYTCEESEQLFAIAYQKVFDSDYCRHEQMVTKRSVQWDLCLYHYFPWIDQARFKICVVQNRFGELVACYCSGEGVDDLRRSFCISKPECVIANEGRQYLTDLRAGSSTCAEELEYLLEAGFGDESWFLHIQQQDRLRPLAPYSRYSPCYGRNLTALFDVGQLVLEDLNNRIEIFTPVDLTKSTDEKSNIKEATDPKETVKPTPQPPSKSTSGTTDPVTNSHADYSSDLRKSVDNIKHAEDNLLFKAETARTVVSPSSSYTGGRISVTAHAQAYATTSTSSSTMQFRPMDLLRLLLVHQLRWRLLVNAVVVVACVPYGYITSLHSTEGIASSRRLTASLRAIRAAVLLLKTGETVHTIWPVTLNSSTSTTSTSTTSTVTTSPLGEQVWLLTVTVVFVLWYSEVADSLFSLYSKISLFGLLTDLSLINTMDWAILIDKLVWTYQVLYTLTLCAEVSLTDVIAIVWRKSAKKTTIVTSITPQVPSNNSNTINYNINNNNSNNQSQRGGSSGHHQHNRSVKKKARKQQKTKLQNTNLKPQQLTNSSSDISSCTNNDVIISKELNINCQKHVTSRNQVNVLPSYNGVYVEARCGDGCVLAYHAECWRALLQSVLGVKRYRAALQTACPGVRCGGLIVDVRLYNRPGDEPKTIIVHRDNELAETPSIAGANNCSSKPTTRASRPLSNDISRRETLVSSLRLCGESSSGSTASSGSSRNSSSCASSSVSSTSYSSYSPSWRSQTSTPDSNHSMTAPPLFPDYTRPPPAMPILPGSTGGGAPPGLPAIPDLWSWSPRTVTPPSPHTNSSTPPGPIERPRKFSSQNANDSQASSLFLPIGLTVDTATKSKKKKNKSKQTPLLMPVTNQQSLAVGVIPPPNWRQTLPPPQLQHNRRMPAPPPPSLLQHHSLTQPPPTSHAFRMPPALMSPNPPPPSQLTVTDLVQTILSCDADLTNMPNGLGPSRTESRILPLIAGRSTSAIPMEKAMESGKADSSPTPESGIGSERSDDALPEKTTIQYIPGKEEENLKAELARLDSDMESLEDDDDTKAGLVRSLSSTGIGPYVVRNPLASILSTELPGYELEDIDTCLGHILATQQTNNLTLKQFRALIITELNKKKESSDEDIFESDIEDPDGECPICMITLDAEPSFRLDSCSHSFHEVCIKQWFSKNETCPTCRTAQQPV